MDVVSRNLTICGEVNVDGAPARVNGLLLALLSVLAVRGARGAERGELVELLWPEAPPLAGNAALDPLLSRLRRVVGPISGRGVVRLDADTSVDVTSALTALANAATAGDPAQTLTLASAAARTLAGPLAPGCQHSWVEAQRVRLAERHAEALTLAAESGTRLTPTPQAALDACRELVALRPLAERPTALLMALFDQSGDRAAAIGAYEAVRVRLREQLGILPGPDLRERHRQLVTADPVALPDALALAARTPLAGRAQLFESAQAALAHAKLMLIEGPPGIGKTHLAALLARAYSETGASVLLARGTRVPAGPFGALGGALRPLFDASRARLGGNAVDRSVDEDEAADRRLVQAVFEGGGAAQGPDLLSARLRLFDAIGRLLATADDGHGVLLVVDDLHDLDPSSRQVLRHLLAPGHGWLTVLVTTRPDAKASAALRDVVTRAGLHEIALEPLDVTGVAALALDVLPGLSAEDAHTLAADLHSRTGGSPLLARAALAAPQRTEDLQAAVAAMVAWAGADAAALLQVAALDDAGAPLDVLAMAGQLELDHAGVALDRARAAGLMAVGTDIVHASVRDALVADLGDARRAAIHRRLAEAYEAADADAAPIASHWGRGETAEAHARSAYWEQRAARRALDALAAEDAERHARQALAHLGQEQAQERVEAMLLLGQALNASSRLAEGREVLRDAQSQARALGDGPLIARIAAEAAGHRLGAGLVDPELVALVEEGLAHAGGHDDAVRSRLAGRLALLLLDGPLARREALVAEAESLARAAGAPDAIAEALLARFTADVHLAQPRRDIGLLDEASGLAHAALRRDLALHARMLRFSALLEAGDILGARREFRVWEDEANAARLPYHQWAAAICLPTLHLLDARRDSALEALATAEALALPLGEDPVVRAAVGGQSVSTGIVAGQLEQVAELVSSVIAIGGATPAWRAARAYCNAVIGDRTATQDDIAVVIDGGLERLVDPNRATALSFLADAAVLARAPDAQLSAIDAALATHDGTFVVQHFGSWVHGPTAARRARLAAARGKLDDARAQLEAAVTLAGPDMPGAIAVDLGIARVAIAGPALRDETIAQARAHDLPCAERVVKTLCDGSEVMPGRPIKY